VGALYHAPGVYGDLTARENLEFARRMWGGRARWGGRGAGAGGADVRAADELARGFSSGMTRRLALARLVMRPPSLLLLDEPYASFDADGIELVNELVRETVDAGRDRADRHARPGAVGGGGGPGGDAPAGPDRPGGGAAPRLRAEVAR
jgi:ABC-type multidrug transport system ATPase subunit